MKTTFKYDKKYDMAYLKFNDHDIIKSLESEDELFVVDLDEENQIVGIEIMSVKRLFTTFGKVPVRPIPKVTKGNIESYLLANSFMNTLCPAST